MERKSVIESKLDPLVIKIKEEFLKRREKNNLYSLRAYAKFLEIDQSYLSKILNGQRVMTDKLRERIGSCFSLSPSEIENLKKVKSGSIESSKFKKIDDQFHLISDWYHFAILEYFKTQDAKADKKIVAKRLGLHSNEAELALKRLERLGFLKFQQDGFTLLNPNNTWSNNKTTSLEKKKLQKTFLEKSLQSLDEVDFHNRDHSSLTVSINKDRLPEFKLKIQEIRKELSSFLQPEGSSELNEVYQLTISLYPLTKLKEN